MPSAHRLMTPAKARVDALLEKIEREGEEAIFLDRHARREGQRRLGLRAFGCKLHEALA